MTRAENKGLALITLGRKSQFLSEVYDAQHGPAMPACLVTHILLLPHSPLRSAPRLRPPPVSALVSRTAPHLLDLFRGISRAWDASPAPLLTHLPLQLSD